MGFAQGTLLKEDASAFIQNVWTFLQNQVNGALPTYFPKWLDDLIADLGLDVALDITEDLTAAYTGEWFFEEMHGIADATGVDFQTIVRVHMIAGLTQGHCSMFGAWGNALAAADSKKVLQLRALDWNMQGPFRDYSQITVYHPSGEGNGHAFANVGFTGFIGGLTGVSETQLGISEIGVVYPDKTFGDQSRVGVPFIFLLRNILQFDYTVDDAISRMVNAARTCDLILGVGDGKLGEFRGFEYSYSTLKVFDDMNMQPNETWHPRIPDTVYWGMDWLCPAYNKVLGTLMDRYHGEITPEVAIKSISAVEQSGDNHIAFYDLTDMELYVSFAAPSTAKGPAAGYARQYTKWDLKTLFAETKPE
eukprot:TRINITY_DN20142_c0_g1_i1.p1 TRINITY_DN20142_c0_g1~~TRINITY_DN20142_c0_g1_i1.p1  ORF type:complete len:404 (+),score=67.83 TRINITY_DN20142_c0_g1_i1:125-1213(+)